MQTDQQRAACRLELHYLFRCGRFWNVTHLYFNSSHSKSKNQILDDFCHKIIVSRAELAMCCVTGIL